MDGLALYKTYLSINLLSLNLRLHLYSYSYIDTPLSLHIIPFKKVMDGQLDLEPEIEKLNLTKPWAALLPLDYAQYQTKAQIEKMFTYGCTAVIIEGTYHYLKPEYIIFTIKSTDYKYLYNIFYSEYRNINDENKKAQLATSIFANAYITKQPTDALSLIDEFFLQIPPILLLVLIIMIWKGFASDDEWVYRSFYDYEDDVISAINMRSDNVCSICYEEYVLDEVIRKLGCEHFFHKSCIANWLSRSNICPICRKDVYRHYSYMQSDVTYL
ncbi:hypothetical protein COBT_000251 [Conglomerata obtusa]